MSRRPRSADDPPTRTPTFVCEVRGRVSRAQERKLLARLEAARQVRVTCLGQARRRARLVRESRAFQHARTLPRDDPARERRVFARRVLSTPFQNTPCTPLPSSSAIPGWASTWTASSSRHSPVGPTAPPTSSCWAKPAGCGAWGRHQLDTVEGKTNTTRRRGPAGTREWT